MNPCQWKSQTKPVRFCSLIAQEGSAMCPRHTFLHNVEREEARCKVAGKTQPDEWKVPRSRAVLLAAGYNEASVSPCKGCGRQIQWFTTPAHKSAPFDPMPDADSPAVSHFATCPAREQFRRQA